MWCISNCSSPFQMQFHFPLNHDYGRKSKGWQKKRVTTMAENYGKNCISCIKVWKSNFWKCQFFFDTVSSLSQPVVSQISSIQTKKKPDKLSTVLTFQQLRINEELIASWSCDDDVPFALIKECTTSLMHPSSEAPYLESGSRKRFPKNVLNSPPKKMLQEFW